MSKLNYSEESLYLVVDMAGGPDTLPKLQQAIEGGVNIIQLYIRNDNAETKDLIEQACDMAHEKQVPVLINERWQLLSDTKLDGVHFDTVPADIEYIRSVAGRDIICGITCGNDLDKVQLAADNGYDYISFCSMFPGTSAGECEIVSMDTVRKARAMTGMPIFAAGGITTDNIDELKGAGLNGVAVISAIMNTGDISSAARKFKHKLKDINTQL